MYLVKKLSNRKCFTINENKTISDLEKTLSINNIGAVVVLNDEGYITGIVSERDIVRNLTLITNKVKTTKVSVIMTNKPITCGLNTSSSELMRIMNNEKIRHIPIVDNHKLLGIVSIGDVVNRLIEKYKEETDLLRNYIQG